MRLGKLGGQVRAAAAIEDLPPLSPERACVVQFRVGAGLEAERFTGRVEHTASAEAAHFDSLEEPVTFMKRIVDQVRYGAPERMRTRASSAAP